jgi:hypothetical protein
MCACSCARACLLSAVWQAIHHAAMRGHTAVVEQLVRAGANPGAKGAHKQSPLQLAATNGNARTVQAIEGLLERKQAIMWMADKGLPVVPITAYWCWQATFLLRPHQRETIFTALIVGTRFAESRATAEPHGGRTVDCRIDRLDTAAARAATVTVQATTPAMKASAARAAPVLHVAPRVVCDPALRTMVAAAPSKVLPPEIWAHVLSFVQRHELGRSAVGGGGVGRRVWEQKPGECLRDRHKKSDFF